MRNPSLYRERIVTLTKGTENGPCMNFRCGSLRFKPRATFFHRYSESWICLGCAQKINAQAMRNKTPKEAISAQEYLMEILKA